MSTMTTQNVSLQGVCCETLSNGLKVYFKSMPGAPRVALYLSVFGGNRVESVPGQSDIIDSLLTQGTSSKNAETIALEIDTIPMDFAISTHKDTTTVSAVMLPEDLEKAVSLMTECLFDSTLNDWTKEKLKLHGELTMQLDSPSSLAKDLLHNALYKGTSYQASAQNILANLDNINSQDLLTSQYKKVYHPSNMMLVVVGDIAVEKLVALLNQYFPKTAIAETMENAGSTQAQLIASNQYVTANRDDSQQLHLYQGWLAPLYGTDEYYAMSVMNNVLGGAGLSSRLFTEIRDKQGLAYNVRSMFETSKYMTSFLIYIGTQPHNREKVLKGFQVECDKLMNVALTPDELAASKRNILGRHLIGLERPLQQAAYLGSKLTFGLSLDEIMAYRQKISDITAEDIQAVAQKYLSQPSIVAAVGPQQYL